MDSPERFKRHCLGNLVVNNVSGTPPANPVHLASSEIKVLKFDLDLLFPFCLQSTGIDIDQNDSSAKRLESWVNFLTQPVCKGQPPVWGELQAEFPDATGAHRLTEYAEWVFFHPFIRNFLYDSKSDRTQHSKNRHGGKSVRILERKDMKSAELKVDYFTDSPQSVTLPIRDVQLYLFDTGIGVVAIRMTRDSVNDTSPLTLKQVLDVQDKVRRLYAPYFDPKPGSGMTIAGHCPDSMTLCRPAAASDQNKSMTASFGTHPTSAAADDSGRISCDEHIAFVQDECEPFTNPVWQELLMPLTPIRVSSDAHNASHDPALPRLSYEHILDDRMPLLSYLAVDDPRRISDGDWLRLAVVDDSGDSDKYPYSPKFLQKDALEGFAYDRFWAMPEDRFGNLRFQGTRWLCCGYGFTAVGHADDHHFFTHETSGARAHARYHYFKLNLIAHFHRASLLVFKKRLADAVEELQQGTSAREVRFKQFEEEMNRIQLDLLAFRNMYWFTEISNQIQPQELFDMQSRHLRNRELFQIVFEESEKAAAFLLALQEQEQTELAARFNVLVAGFVVITPIVSVMFSDDVSLTARLFGTIALSVGALLVLLGLSQFLKRGIQCLSTYRNGRGARGPSALGYFAAVLGVALVALAIFCRLNARPNDSGHKPSTEESRSVTSPPDGSPPE